MEAFAGRPTLDQLLDGVATQIASGFVRGFFDLGLGDESTTGYFLSDDHKLLFILTRPLSEKQRFTGDREAIDGIRRAVRDLRGDFPGVRVGVTGKPALANDEMTSAFRDSENATILGFTLTLLLLVAAFARLGKPIVMLSVLAVSLAWSVGVKTLVIGHLSHQLRNLLPVPLRGGDLPRPEPARSDPDHGAPERTGNAAGGDHGRGDVLRPHGDRGAPRARSSTYNLLHLQATGTESVIWERRILETAGRSGFSALAGASSVEELRAKSEAFSKLPTVSEVDSALLLIPDGQPRDRGRVTLAVFRAFRCPDGLLCGLLQASRATPLGSTPSESRAAHRAGDRAST